MLSFTQKELFEVITSTSKWYKTYCTANHARVLRDRHRKGTLSQESYDNLFFYFGYKKELIWTKN